MNKREYFREAFDNFDVNKICNYNDEKVQELLKNENIVRNKLKINAAITNSKIFKKIIYEMDKSTNKLSDRLSENLRKRGMKFVGSTIIYSYLQAIGVIYSHDTKCFMYKDR